MKSTGILKSIDLTGRVVIPRDIRRSMRLQEGDLLEVCVEGDYCCFRKYEEVSNLQNILQDLDYSVRRLQESYSESSEIVEMRKHINSIKALLDMYTCNNATT